MAALKPGSALSPATLWFTRWKNNPVRSPRSARHAFENEIKPAGRPRQRRRKQQRIESDAGVTETPQNPAAEKPREQHQQQARAPRLDLFPAQPEPERDAQVGDDSGHMRRAD